AQARVRARRLLRRADLRGALPELPRFALGVLDGHALPRHHLQRDRHARLVADRPAAQGELQRAAEILVRPEVDGDALVDLLRPAVTPRWTSGTAGIPAARS